MSPLARVEEVTAIGVHMVTSEQATQIAGCGSSTLTRACQAGRLRFYVRAHRKQRNAPKTARRNYYFTREDLAEWVAAGRPTIPLAPPASTPLLAPSIDVEADSVAKELAALRADVSVALSDIKKQVSELMAMWAPSSTGRPQ